MLGFLFLIYENIYNYSLSLANFEIGILSINLPTGLYIIELIDKFGKRANCNFFKI